MNLKFVRNEESQIIVTQVTDGKENDFNYVEMIKSLIKLKEMEEPEISKDFSEPEIKSIKSMVAYINKAIIEKDKIKTDGVEKEI